MSFRIACHMDEKCPCFEIIGEAADHMDRIARYVNGKSPNREGIMLDLRAVTKKPAADQLFIHVLKYPNGCHRKIALIDLKENRAFFQLYECLVRTRGYQAQLFGDRETAYDWLQKGNIPPRAHPPRVHSVRHTLAAFGQSVNPMRLLHATSIR